LDFVVTTFLSVFFDLKILNIPNKTTVLVASVRSDSHSLQLRFRNAF